MSTGYPPPGAQPNPEPASYQPVPVRPGFAAPSFAPPAYSGPSYGPPDLSDHDLRQLPPPVPSGPPSAGPARGLQARPAVIPIATTLAVTASLQWMCALSLVWVTATVGASELGQQGDEGAIFHILNRFHYRMVDGLAWPLFGFPLVSFVTGFLLLTRRAWTRIVHTVVGALAIAWSAWWLRNDLSWWFSAAAYVAIACLILWTPAASRWYTRRQ